jgi:hypothetical protein
MSSVALLYVCSAGLGVGGVGGLALGFVWYERKCGLLADHAGGRRATIWSGLGNVFRPR